MALSTENKKIVQNVIFERAYEIENKLSEDNYFLANLVGIKPEKVSDESLKIAVMELNK